MAVRKKGSRRIVVDGVTYLWRFPPRPTSSQDDYWPGCHVTVQREGCKGSVLVIYFPQFLPNLAKACGDPVVPVLPSQVARAIRAAVRAGWRAEVQGPQFAIEGDNASPEADDDGH